MDCLRQLCDKEIIRSREMTKYAYCAGALYDSDPESFLENSISSPIEFLFKSEHIYLVKIDDETILILRGTNWNDIEDIESDILIAVGKEELASRCKEAYDFISGCAALNPNCKFTIVGHSLSGSACNYLTTTDLAVHINKVYTFNQFETHFDDNKFRDYYNAYFIKGDIISNLGILDKTINVYVLSPKKDLNYHTIRQFY